MGGRRDGVVADRARAPARYHDSNSGGADRSPALALAAARPTAWALESVRVTWNQHERRTRSYPPPCGEEEAASVRRSSPPTPALPVGRGESAQEGVVGRSPDGPT